jgi:phenylpropionate dioxygenase-like ring-hydroxylating dioxygenase large terminal subunit
VNMCRHRGFPVAQEASNRKSLTCAYHGWTYELDGRLRNAPRCQHEQDFDKSDYPLQRVAIDVWNGFVWANPDPEAGRLLDTHPELDEICGDGSGDFDFDPYQAKHQRYAFEIPANWKVAVENLIECYHCPTIHTSTFAAIFELGHTQYQCINRGKTIEHFAPRRADSPLDAASNGYPGSNGRMIVLWPGSYIFTEGLFAMASAFVPTGPETTHQYADVWARSDLPDEVVADWVGFHTLALQEDIAAVSALQPSLRSRALPQGRLLPASESSVAHFQQLVWRAVSESVSLT